MECYNKSRGSLHTGHVILPRGCGEDLERRPIERGYIWVKKKKRECHSRVRAVYLLLVAPVVLGLADSSGWRMEETRGIRRPMNESKVVGLQIQ